MPKAFLSPAMRLTYSRLKGFINALSLKTVHIQNILKADIRTDLPDGPPDFIADKVTELLRQKETLRNLKTGQLPIRVIVGNLCKYVLDCGHEAPLSAPCKAGRRPGLYVVQGVQRVPGQCRFWLDTEHYRSLRSLHAVHSHLRILDGAWSC